MIAAGAGGGIAATFNTPIGGVLFAAELLLHEVSVWTLVPVVISTATATYIGRLFLVPALPLLSRRFRPHIFTTPIPWCWLHILGWGAWPGWFQRSL